MSVHDGLAGAVIVVVVAPALLLGLLGVPSLAGRPLGEAAIRRLTSTIMMSVFVAALAACTLYVVAGAKPDRMSYALWFGPSAPTFSFELLVDGMALAFATLSAGICGVVSAFSHRYLHQEPGYNRYFVLFAAFATGMGLIAFAGSIDVLFAGWELIGLSSALLVGFFHERVAPLRNALRVFAVYRISDAAMFSAAVLLHAWTHSGSMASLFAGGAEAAASLTSTETTVIGVLLIAAVAGKSALLPFSGWLPRAMEGPTPSSAVYYGALSVHAGCFLLLRVEPVIGELVLLRVLVVLAGATTAIYANLIGRAQSDIKSALAFASLTQVGIIVVEIGLGLTTLAFVHLAGHACYRLLQLLSAPNVLHDLHELERLAHDRPAPVPASPRRPHPVYVFALERGFVDALIDRFVVAPFVRLARWLTVVDGWLCAARRPRSEGRRDP